MGSISTNSGGTIDVCHSTNRLTGAQCYLHVDQTNNIKNAECDVTIMLSNNEVKALIAHLNDYIVFTEGVPHVVLAEPLMHPDVVISVNNQIVEKVAENINKYLTMNEIDTPGEINIDHSDYFGSIKSRINIPKI